MGSQQDWVSDSSLCAHRSHRSMPTHCGALIYTDVPGNPPMASGREADAWLQWELDQDTATLAEPQCQESQLSACVTAMAVVIPRTSVDG